MEISAAQVKSLRETTGAGMMDCKKALVAAQGDFDAAIKWLEKQALVTASKKAARVAAEGMISKAISKDGHQASLVETNSETDFVGRSDEFVGFANAVAECVLASKTNDIDVLMNAPYQSDNLSVAQKCQQLIAKIGENIVTRRCVFVESAENLGVYVHNNRIGVIVDVKGGDAELAKGLAMHIAAANPLFLNEAEISDSVLSEQKQLIKTKLQQTNKPADIIEQMLKEELEQYVNQVCLDLQQYILNPEQTVAQVLNQAKASVKRFYRLELGEGIEKNQTDFVAEVMAQARGAS